MAWYDLFESALGRIFIGGSDAGLHRIDFLTEQHTFTDGVCQLKGDTGEAAGLDHDAAQSAIVVLAAYFAGESSDFDLLLAPRGTIFQQRVWKWLQSVPAGSTISYGAVGRGIHKPGSARAVGAAVGRNPISLLVPCHRVINADGSLGGYGGGIERKRWLLAHEERWRPTL